MACKNSRRTVSGMDEPTLAASALEARLSGPLIAVRIDGVAFSTLTKDPVFDAPYDCLLYTSDAADE